MRVIEINDNPDSTSTTWVDGIRMEGVVSISRDTSGPISTRTTVTMDNVPIRDCMVFKNGLLVARAIG